MKDVLPQIGSMVDINGIKGRVDNLDLFSKVIKIISDEGVTHEIRFDDFFNNQ